MEKKEEILRVRNLDISFETTAGVVNAVRGVNLTVNRGETVAIVGESGSGKSVSAKAIMGILAKNGTIDRGQITFSYYRNPEERVTREILQMKKEEIRRHINGKRIAMVFQDPMTSLNPLMPVGKQIMEGMIWHYHTPKEEAYKKALELMKLVGITDAEKRIKNYPHQLSGGMRQRIVIAIALACDPELLICDEPTTALDVTIQAQVLELTERVLQRLDARKRLHEMMHREGSELVIGRRRHDLSRYRHVYAFSSGKAGNHMARAFEDLLGEYLTLGVTIIKLRDEEDVYRKTEVYVGGHPLPNEEGIRGCQRMIDIAEQMGPDDLLLLGLTGGCSALMGYPVEGTTLEDLQEATDVMLKAGMWVMDINDIRGHLSRMSRGRLGQHIHGAKILCFEIWDAVGLDDITDYTEPVPIMGTPVGYDTVTFEDIGAILRKYHIEDKLPPNVARYLLDYDPAQETPQTMTNDVDYYIVNTLPDSCQAALEAAEEMGIPAHVLTTYAEGESRDYGTFMASLAHEVVKNERPFRAPCFLFSAGETTTAIPDSSLIRGHGGPSQEMTAAFAVAAEGLKNVCLLSMDSEGTDGTTPVAGGLTDGTTGTAAAERGIDLRKALREHAAYEALEPLGDTVLTGNTGTNLCDFNVLYIGTQE